MALFCLKLAVDFVYRNSVHFKQRVSHCERLNCSEQFKTYEFDELLLNILTTTSSLISYKCKISSPNSGPRNSAEMHWAQLSVFCTLKWRCKMQEVT